MTEQTRHPGTRPLLAALSSLFIACAHGATPAGPGAAPPAASAGQTVHVDGAELRYVQRGKGTPIVFVHGSLGDLDDFRAQAEAFAGQHRTLAYSRRYHPPNAPPSRDGEYAMEVHASDLDALLRAQEAAPAIIVASSYGAYTSLYLAIRHPEAVRALVLGEPPLLPWLQQSEEGREAFAAFKTGVLDPARAAFAQGDDEGGLRAFLDGVSGKRGRFDSMPPEVRADLKLHGPEMRRELLTPFDRYMPAIACAEVSALRMPILLVEGEQSPRMFHITSEMLAGCAKGARRVTIPKAGHAMHAGNPVAYQEALERFFRDNGL